MLDCALAQEAFHRRVLNTSISKGFEVLFESLATHPTCKDLTYVFSCFCFHGVDPCRLENVDLSGGQHEQSVNRPHTHFPAHFATTR